jgi:hypothetical protein
MPHRQRLAELLSASMDIRRALCVSDPRVALIQSMSECYFLPFAGITVGGRTQLENGAETAFHHSRIAISLISASEALLINCSVS